MARCPTTITPSCRSTRVSLLCEHFKVKSLDGFGCSDMPAAIAAAGAIIHYLKHQLRQKDRSSHGPCVATTSADHVMLDAATQVNLELVASRGARDTSLLAALDRTVTPMGGRKLRTWILQPLRDLAELERRQQLIADLLQEPDLLASLRDVLQIDPRPRARLRPTKPGVGKRA